jgi:Domain of unknown function (DUF4234)
MAYEVNANGAVAKVRNPWGVLGLGLITLGIYTIFWYYYINREAKEYGAAQGDQELAESQPGMSVLAITLGALIIVPAIVSYYRTILRMQRIQELGGVEKVNGWIVLILILVISPAAPPYIQSTLNKLWERYPSLAEGAGGAIPAGTEQPQAPAQQPVSQAQQPVSQEQQPPPPPAQ